MIFNHAEILTTLAKDHLFNSALCFAHFLFPPFDRWELPRINL